MVKTAKRITIERVVGILLFLILIYAANIITGYFNNEEFTQVVHFFNDTLYLFITIMVLSLIAELLFNLKFPFDLVGPIMISGVAVFTVLLIIEALKFVGKMIDLDMFGFLDDFKYPILIIVIVLTLIIGYVQIFKSFLDAMDEEAAAKASIFNDPYIQPKTIPQNNLQYQNPKNIQNNQAQNYQKDQEISNDKNELGWNQVNDAYKQAFYLFAKSLKSFFDTKIKK